MRLTEQTRYAVRVLAACAQVHPEVVAVKKVAADTGLTEFTIFKLLKTATRAGLVASVRGRNGGIRLARPANEITLVDVVTVTEENFAMAECFDGGVTDCPLVFQCELNAALRQALDAFLSTLGRFSIADLVENRPFMSQTLGIPMAPEHAALS